MDQSVAILAMDGRPWRTAHRPRRPLGFKLIVSLWLHLTLVALLLVTVRYQRLAEELPPPAEVALVFEGGKPEGPAVPEPRPPVALPVEPPAPPPALPPAVPPALPAPPQPAVPPPVALLPPAPLPPAAVQPSLPTPPIPPALLQPSPPPPLPRPPDQPGPDSVPLRPPPVAVPPPRPAAPAQRPQPPVVAPKPSSPDGFPAPMEFSLNRAPPAPSRNTPRPSSRGGSQSPSTLDFTLAPRQGATDNTPFSRLTGMRIGPDWRNELSAWVRKHAYYPPQAAMNGEDGAVTVQVVMEPNGRVTSVELERKSGSKWLDMALVAMFRDADLPARHDETAPFTFHFTMNYILILVQ